MAPNSDQKAQSAGTIPAGDATPEDRTPRAEYHFVKPVRWSWWISGAIVALIAAALGEFLVTGRNWQWDVVAEYLFHPDILAGLRNTVILTVTCAVTGLFMGAIVAYLRMSANPVFRAVGAAYIWFIRAIPALVLLLFIFFLAALLPRISIGLPFLPPFATVPTNSLISKSTAAILGLTLIQGAYIGEIYRGGLLSVPHGQLEAARSMGMTNWQAMRRVVVPQCIRVVIPPLGNEMITLFKNTSLVFVIGYTELLTTVQLIYGESYQTIPLLVVACVWYLALTSLAMLGQRQLEKRFGKGFRAITSVGGRR
ncbi:amino acid ABC transporter permease [Amycolatopsis taiwanensis]|uniref:Amino acid ABC transporter permease n=1 Tax=Amycolatopsis taiwanensis TaxID=342230 RepID=A0A9W6VKC6_9PSEU|nr:amino acid ABC transporter permease [Amycolatopsis taiwanensis]GLY71555.1 amino acid ABC transporter permease [Amycolatopsis taiwanensis]